VPDYIDGKTVFNNKRSAVQRLIIFICEMVLGKRLAGRQKNLQPGGVG